MKEGDKELTKPLKTGKKAEDTDQESSIEASNEIIDVTSQKNFKVLIVKKKDKNS